MPVDMEQLVQETLKDLDFVITEKNARIAIRLPLPIIIADKTQLYQVTLNLLSNAVKYTSTILPVVEISCEEKEQAWHFSIKDNGIGIEQKYHEKVFGLFQRLHKRGEYSGTGIGLAIVKKIVETGGGSIFVSSEPGNGCCFTFTVPKALEKYSP
jgi:light-regulated signal transduction histidine kinase (bacteriophytochrome)